MRNQMSEAPTFWMNVTTSTNWHRSPVGIVRTEQEIRRHLGDALGDRLQPVVFKEGSFVLESAISSSATAGADDFWPEPSYGCSPDPFDLLQAPAAGSLPTHRHAGPRRPSFGYGDVLITMGLDWDHPGLNDEISRLAKAYNLTVIVCCYDLIPVLFPQYCVGDVASWFKDYFISMTWSADGVLCISENTRCDYLSLAQRLGLPARRTEVIRLGSSLPPQTDDAPVSKEVEQILGGRFFLFVSTIERRKNHEVLYRAYHLLREENRDADLPKLVFVGMEGWGIGELMSDIRLDPLTKGYIHILPQVSDSELLLLYRRCEALLFPSFYEGWGMPIAEALQLGKPVLASDAGSIPEVGGDLVRYVDPWSPRKWADELRDIADGKLDLNAWSTRIAETFVPYEWSSAANAIISLADDLRRAKPSSRVFEAGYDLSTLHGVHYGGRIIYRGRQGIVCHGPYTTLAEGPYEVSVQVELVEAAPGLIRFKAAANRSDTLLATMDVDARLLRPGRHQIILETDVPEEVNDFELICEVDCVGDVKIAVEKIEISRIEAVVAQPSTSKANALA